MINEQNLVNDGLTEDGSCRNNGQMEWRYNQGVVLGVGGLVGWCVIWKVACVEPLPTGNRSLYSYEG